MLRTTTVTFEGAEITLTRPTIADARLRWKLWKCLDEATNAASVFTYYITQIVSTKGLPQTPAHQRLTTFPGVDEAKALFEQWSLDLDEPWVDLINNAVLLLRDTTPSAGPNAPSAT